MTFVNTSFALVAGGGAYGLIGSTDYLQVQGGAGAFGCKRATTPCAARQTGFTLGTLGGCSHNGGSGFYGFAAAAAWANIPWDANVLQPRVGFACGQVATKRWKFVACDGAALTAVDLTTFSADFGSDSLHEFWFWLSASAADLSKVQWRAVNLFTGADTGVQDALVNLPPASTPMCNGAGVANGGVFRATSQLGMAGVA